MHKDGCGDRLAPRIKKGLQDLEPRVETDGRYNKGRSRREQQRLSTYSKAVVPQALAHIGNSFRACEKSRVLAPPPDFLIQWFSGGD